MKKLALCLLLAFAIPIFAQAPEQPAEPAKEKVEDKESLPLTKYKPLYLLIGSKQDQTQVQVSFKYSLFDPHLKNLYLGYSHVLTWALFQPSAPATNMDFMPEFFYRIPLLDDKLIIDLGPFIHKSNGRNGAGNRSVDGSYARVEWNLPIWKVKIGNRYRYQYSYNIAGDNIDIASYDTFELTGFIKWSSNMKYIDQEEFFVTWILGNTLEAARSTQVFGLKFRTVLPFFRPKFFLKIQNGYLNDFLTYNQKQTTIRFGLIFE